MLYRWHCINLFFVCVCVCICLLAWLAGGVVNIKCCGVVLYCTIVGDHRSRGRYDSLWSVLRPDQFDPLHSRLNVCKVCVCMSDVLQLTL